MKPNSTEETATGESQDGSLSVKEVADRVGVSTQAVRSALREGRLLRCNPASERPRFKVEEVDRWISHRQGEMSQPMTHDRAMAETELAKAGAVTDLVESSHKHTEQSWSDTRAMVGEMRKAHQELNSALHKELARLQTRIDFLEGERDDLMRATDALREYQYQERVRALDEEGARKKLDAAIRTITPFAGAAIARFIGGEQAQQGAFMMFVDSLTGEQRDKIFETLGGILTQEQAGTLMTLFAQWDAKKSKEAEKEKAGPHDTDRPPQTEATT